MDFKPAANIRLFVTMTHRIYRDALLHDLINQDYIDLVGESSSGSETLSLLSLCSPTTLIIEEDLRDNDGLTIAEMALAQNPSLTIILLVDSDINRNRLSIYLDSGIKSVVSKTQDIHDLSLALIYTRTGQVYIDAERYRLIQGLQIKKTTMTNVEPFYLLSDREQEVARLMARRIPVKQIALQLGVSHKTIHTHKERILTKLGFRRLPELILFMQQLQFQQLQESTRL
jgi:two-component system invasion response regulator UvrY